MSPEKVDPYRSRPRAPAADGMLERAAEILGLRSRQRVERDEQARRHLAEDRALQERHGEELAALARAIAHYAEARVRPLELTREAAGGGADPGKRAPATARSLAGASP